MVVYWLEFHSEMFAQAFWCDFFRDFLYYFEAGKRALNGGDSFMCKPGNNNKTVNFKPHPLKRLSRRA